MDVAISLPLGVAALGVLLGVIGAIAWHGPHPNAKPTCAGEVMSPGDTCRFDGPPPGRVLQYQSYEERLDEATRSIGLTRIAWVMIALGGLVFIALWSRVVRRVQRRR